VKGRRAGRTSMIIHGSSRKEKNDLDMSGFMKGRYECYVCVVGNMLG
jgi:hypothetical protein